MLHMVEDKARLPNRLEMAADETWPFFAPDEVEAVTGVLKSGKVNQWTGDKVTTFEDAYSEAIGTGRSIALANGSLALELALRAFGVGPGDEVIVTPRTFVASAFCARLVGATPIFADVDGSSGNVTAATIRAVLTPRTRAIIPVHLAGWPADMPAIMALAREHGVLVIEDCAQAHGAEIGGKPVGSFGDAAAFSFCQDKIITTGGEGGLVSFRDDAAYNWAWSFKDHGKNRDKIVQGTAQPGFRWLHDQVGTNWRMLEMSAAIGLIQLKKLDEWRRVRERNARIWADTLARVDGLRVPLPSRDETGAFYKFYVYVNRAKEDNAALRDRILEGAGQSGLRAFSGSCPEVYREEAFADLDVPRLEVARELGESSIMLEVHPTLHPDRLRERADALATIAASVLR